MLSPSDPNAAPTLRDRWAVGFAIGLPTLVTLVYFVWSEGMDSGLRQAIYGAAKIVQFGFPICWVWLVQRRALQLWPILTRGTWIGLGFGLVVLISTLGLYHGWMKSAVFFQAATEPIREKIAGLGVASPGKFAALGLFYSLFHSLMEEYYWRWFVFDQLKRLISLRMAIAISSLGFMAHHVIVVATFFGFTSPMTWFLSLSVAVGGVFWAWLYHRTESLWGPWLGHLLVDAAIFAVGYDIAMPLFGNT